jgi:heme/copper-type cytochrome/quinol oxidase subunit 1
MTVIETPREEGQQVAEEEPIGIRLVAEPAPPTGLGGLIGTADHKVIGRLYLVCSLVFLGAALVLSTLVGLEGIDLSKLDLLSTNTYFQVFTLSFVGLVFLGVLPAFIGLAIHIVPLQVGSPSIAFPRAAAASFWGWLFGSGLLIAGWAINGGPGGGRLEGVLLSFAAWGLVILSLCTAAVCLATTVVSLRTEGMGLLRVPAFAWSMLVASVLWLITLPVLGANLLLIFVDTDHGRIVFGQPLAVWPELRWIFLQPAVFALAVPVLGIAAEIVAVMARRPAKAHAATLVSIGVFGAFAFGPWAQVAFNPRLVHQATYIIFSFAVILPVLIAFGGLADTLRRGRPRPAGALGLAMLAVVALLAATLAAALHSISALDLQPTTWGDGITKLVIGSALLAITAGVFYWSPKMWGRLPTEALAKLLVLVVAGGATLFAGGELLAGGLGQLPAWPSGVPEVVKNAGEVGSTLSAIGAIILIFGVILVLLALLPLMAGKGRAAGADPWDGHTLEWAAASPPPFENFEGPVPVVGSAVPLLDARRAGGALPAEEVS